MNILYYTGIGSRDISSTHVEEIKMWARRLANAGYILRSGGAPGADDAFETPTQPHQKAIYIPWAGFEKRQGTGVILAPKQRFWPKALEIAQSYHPYWERLNTDGKRALMGRNVFQVLGADLHTPSEFVLCWASGVKLDDKGLIRDVKGGTGLAVRLAYHHGIKVYHLDFPDHMMELEKKISSHVRSVVGAVLEIPATNRPEPIAEPSTIAGPATIYTGRWVRSVR